jgi:hypothetical protein
MPHLLPQETPATPEPAGPLASLMYIGLLPIEEGVIDVGIADEDTDGYIGHDRHFSAYCNLVS